MVALLDADTEGSLEELRGVMSYLGVSNGGAGNPGGKLENLTQGYVLLTDVLPMLEHGPVLERGHPIRVAMLGVGISINLGFDRNACLLKLLTDISHDRGKLKFRNFYELAPRDIVARNKIRFGHIAPENIPMEYGPHVACGIERHHSLQGIVSPPYPAKPSLPATEEGILLAQLNAIPDLWDALTTRPSMENGKMRSLGEAIDLLTSVYGEMRIKYDGRVFPKINIVGKKIIDDSILPYLS